MNRQKIVDFLNKVFGWCIYACLVAGGLAFFGFLFALIIGGGKDSVAQSISIFIHKQYFPIVIRASAITIGIGLLAMYIGKTSALSIAADKKEAEDELKTIKAEQKKD